MRSSGERDRAVLVVGAGPVGLTAALALRAHDVPATVLEQDPVDRVRPGSRALFVHRDSLALLEEAHPGLGERIARHGVVWRTRRTLYRGREVYARTFPPAQPGVLPPFTSLRQVETERHLLDACHAAGVRFEWDARITDVEATPDGVTIAAADGRSWSAGHVIAADGARSAVRQALGIPMAGVRSRGSHVVVDVADPPGGPPADERIFHYEHPGLHGRTVLRVPFAGGYQVDLQCFDDEDPDVHATPDAVRRWLPDVVADVPGQVLWISAYRFLQVVAARFVDDQHRVLLVGEAAHLFPPFGARGMNSGIADAVEAATAVAASRAPGAGTGPVAGFAAARRAAALFNSAAAGTALRRLRPGPVMRVRQYSAAALAPLVPRCAAWLERAPYGPRKDPAGPRRY